MPGQHSIRRKGSDSGGAAVVVVGLVGVAVVLVEVGGRSVVVATAVMVVTDPADPCLAAAPAVAPMISFACEPERGLVAGSLVVDVAEGDIVVGCSCCVVMGGSKTLFSTRNGFMGETIATTKRLIVAAF